MGSALSSPLLRTLVSALRNLLRRIANPTLAQAVRTRLVRRLALWAAFLRSKTSLDKEIDKQSKGHTGASKEDSARKTQQDAPLAYTVVRKGDAVSLNGVALSSYPYSVHGIRNSSSVRLERPHSRTSSRNRGSDTHSIAPSTGGLSIIIPTAPTSRPPSQLRSRISTDNLSWFSRRRSPSPDLPPPITVEEPVSPAEGHSDATEAHVHFQPEAGNTTLSEHHTDPSLCGSPLPDQLEVKSHGDEMNLKESCGSSLRPPSRPPSSAISSYSSPSIEGSLHELVTPEIISLTQILFQNTPTSEPVIPQSTKRYDRRTKISRGWTNIDLEPMTTVFEKPSSRPGWLMLVHPEGARYFYHTEKRVYTDSDLYDPVVYDRLMDEIHRLKYSIQSLDKTMREKAVLMVDVFYADNDRNSLQSEYYYVDLTERAVFFVEPLETVFMGCVTEVYGPKSIQHLGFEIQSQYWYFVSLYPHCSALTDEMLCELRDIILFLIGDQMTSPYSTAPYTMDDLFKILSLVDGMEKNMGKSADGTMSLFARHMHVFYHSKFLNCYGETFSRVERDFSIFGDKIDKRTWLVKTLSPILFSAPDIHLRNLQKMWVDGLLHKSVWVDSTNKLNDEWQEFIFFATVMLTSNVGYLAIQSVDLNDGAARSPGQIASYLSVVANIGSIILGLLLMRQNRTKIADTAGELEIFLRKKNHWLVGLETLAILYSLPYALLMWGVVAFLVAFCCVFFRDSTSECRAWVGSLSLAVAILIVWCIWTSWGDPDQKEENNRPLVSADAPFYYGEEESEEPKSGELGSTKMGIFDKIRDFPKFLRRRDSDDSDATAV